MTDSKAVVATDTMATTSRRRFLGLAFGAGLLALLGEGMVTLLGFLTPRLKVGTFGTRMMVGKVDDFPVGSVTYFEEGRFYLVRLATGFLALYRRCTHLGCVVPWVEAEKRFNCPCHSSIFDEKGVVIGGPAPRPLDLFRVEIDGGQVWVDTSRPIERSRFEERQVTRI